jgi:hypothetical protein
MFEAALNSAMIYPHRFEVPRLSCSCASPTAPRVCGFGVDLPQSGILDVWCYSSPSLVVVHGWPVPPCRHGHRQVTLHPSSTPLSTPSSPSARALPIDSYMCMLLLLLFLLCLLDALPMPTAAILLLIYAYWCYLMHV